MMTIKVTSGELSRALGYTKCDHLVRFIRTHIATINKKVGPLEDVAINQGRGFLITKKQAQYICKLMPDYGVRKVKNVSVAAAIRALFRKAERLQSTEGRFSSIEEMAKGIKEPVGNLVFKDKDGIRISHFAMSTIGLGVFHESYGALKFCIRYMIRNSQLHGATTTLRGKYNREHILLTKDQWLSVCDFRSRRNPVSSNRAMKVINKVFEEASALLSTSGASQETAPVGDHSQTDLNLSAKNETLRKQAKIINDAEEKDKTFLGLDGLSAVLGKPVSELVGDVKTDYPISFATGSDEGYVTAGEAFAIMMNNSEEVAAEWKRIKDAALFYERAGGKAHIDSTREKMSSLLKFLAQDYAKSNASLDTMGKYITSTIVAMGDEKHAGPLGRILTAEIHNAQEAK